MEDGERLRGCAVIDRFFGIFGGLLVLLRLSSLADPLLLRRYSASVEDEAMFKNAVFSIWFYLYDVFVLISPRIRRHSNFIKQTISRELCELLLV